MAQRGGWSGRRGGGGGGVRDGGGLRGGNDRILLTKHIIKVGENECGTVREGNGTATATDGLCTALENYRRRSQRGLRGGGRACEAVMAPRGGGEPPPKCYQRQVVRDDHIASPARAHAQSQMRERCLLAGHGSGRSVEGLRSVEIGSVEIGRGVLACPSTRHASSDNHKEACNG